MTANGNRANGKGRQADPGDDNGGGADRARQGGRNANANGRVESVAPAAAAAAENGDTSAATAVVGEREAAVQPPSGGPPERGTKRLSEVELEAAAVAMASGSGAGERGALGRPRGKIPRGRNHTSPAAPGVSSLAPAAPAALAVEGSARGRSPM